MKMKLSSICLPVICSLLFSLAPANAAIELVANGGFETGDFSDWTEFPDPLPSGAFQGVGTGAQRSGAASAFFGTFDDTSGIAQNLSTTANATYILSFYLANSTPADPPSTLNSFEVRWEGLALQLPITSPFNGGSNADPFEYTSFAFSVVATSNHSLLEFEFQNDAGFFDLDDVSVTTADAMPEPASITLWSLSAIAVGLACRRRRKMTG